MYLANLGLFNFRNYESQQFSLSPGITVIEGDNGQGKSNILEAVYYLSLLRSFRTGRVSDLRRLNSSFFRLTAELRDPGNSLVTENLTIIHSDKRNLRVNSRSVPSAVDFINHFLCLAFTHRDSELVIGSPVKRRRFINMLAARLDSSYVNSLINYTAALRNRNMILRDIRKYSVSMLDIYDSLLVQHGLPIIITRWKLIQKLNFNLIQTAEQLGEAKAELKIQYSPKISKDNSILKLLINDDQESLASRFTDTLRRNREVDIERGVTKTGPHRDELLLYLHNRPLAPYASEGQTRVFVTALKLAAAALTKEYNPEKALVLLVDDIFAELDNTHRNKLIHLLAEYRQLIIACTEIPKEFFKYDISRYSVSEGRVERIDKKI